MADEVEREGPTTPKKRKSQARNEKKESPIKKKKKKAEEDECYTEITFKFEMRDPNLTFTALESFVKNAQEWTPSSGYDIVAGYCRTSAECVEIFQVLEAGKRKSTELQKIFGALEAILLRVLDDLTNYKIVGQNIVRKMLTAHLSQVYFSLNQQNKSSQIKTTLKLLTTMVMLGESSAKAVLAQFDFSNRNIKPLFIRRNSKDSQDVRTCMLHFIMAFFMLNSDMVIKQILEVKGFIGNMFEGMVYDDASTLHAVLSTLLEKVVRNTNISKTLKVRVFNEATLKHLRMLYFWKGLGKWSEKRDSKVEELPENPDEDKNEDLKSVAELTHKILLDLCCSYNQGIIFSDHLLGLSGKNQNHILTGFLTSCSKSVDHERTRGLVVRTLKACPDQLIHYLPSIASSLVPRPSTRWCSYMEFLCKIYDSQSDKCPVLKSRERQSVNQLVNMLLVPVLPAPSILQHIQQALIHKHLTVRHCGMRVMKTLVQRAVATLKFLNKDGRTKMAASYADADMENIVALFKEQFFKAMPDRKTIFTCWKKLMTPATKDEKDEIDDKQTADMGDKDIPTVELYDHMVIIEQVLCLLQELSPSFLDENPDDINNLLEGLRILGQHSSSKSSHKEGLMDTNSEPSDGAVTNSAVEGTTVEASGIDRGVLPLVYFLKLLSGTDARRLPWVKQSSSGHSLMYLLLDMMSKIPGHDKMMSTMQQLMCQLVTSTGLFEQNKFEVLLWFRHFTSFLQSHNKDVLIDFLSKVFTTFISNPFPYIDKVSEFMTTAATMVTTEADNDAMDTMSVGTSDSAINNILEMDDDEIEQLSGSEETSCNTFRLPFSPLMIVALESLEKNKEKENEVSRYLSEVLIDLTHIQQDPQTLICMIQCLHNNNLDGDVLAYLMAFSPATKTKKQQKLIGQQVNPLLAELSHKLMLFYLKAKDVGQKERQELRESLPQVATGDMLLLVSQMVLYIHTTMVFSEVKKERQSKSLLSALWEFLDDIIKFVVAVVDSQESQEAQDISAADAELKDFREKSASEVLCEIYKCILGHPTIQSYFLCQNDLSRSGHGWMEVTERLVKETSTQICHLSVDILRLRPTDMERIMSPYFEKIINSLDKLDNEKFDQVELFVKQTSSCLTSEVHQLLLKKMLEFPVKKMIDKKSTCLLPAGKFVVFLVSLLKDKDKSAFPKLEFDDLQVLTSILPYSELHSLDLACLHLLREQPHLSVAVGKSVFLTCLTSCSEKRVELAEIVVRQNSFARNWFENWMVENEIEDEATKIQLLPVSLAYLELFSIRGLEGRTKMEPYIRRLTDMYKHSLHQLQTSESAYSYPSKIFKFFSILLQTNFLDVADVQEVCSKVTEAMSDLSTVSHYHAKLLNLLCSDTLQKERRKLLFVHCYDCLTGALGKKRQPNSELTSSIMDILLSFQQEELEDIYTRKQQKEWPTFVKVLLKYFYTDARTFKLIARMLPIVYPTEDETQLYISTLFQMILTHSKFLPTMFNEEHAHNKEPLVDLLIRMVELDPTLCKTPHISILLGSYGATLAPPDQKILKLLNMYEKNEADFKSYRPYLWGEKAIEHHTVRNTLGPSLWKQPSVEQVLEYLDSKKLQTSVLNFPLCRKLQPWVVQTALECQSSEECYDPCFLLSLFSQLLSPDSLIDCRKFIEVNALGYIFAALSSHDGSVRGAAYHLLTNFVYHLQGAYFQEKQQMEYLMQLLRDSLEKPNTKLPCIITIFLARAAVLMLHPDDHMYKMLNLFLLIKPTLDLGNVPEFYKLFNSSALEYKQERDWMLSLLADGLRETSDYRLFEKRYILKILLTYHDSAMSDSSSQMQILKILRNACKGRTTSRDMVKNHDVVSWISGTIATRKLEPKRIDVMTDILHNLWFAMLGNKHSQKLDGAETRSLPPIFTKSMQIALQTLMPSLGIETSSNTYIKYLEILHSVLSHVNLTNENSDVKGHDPRPPTLTMRDVCLLLYNTAGRSMDVSLSTGVLRILKILKYDSLISASETNSRNGDSCSTNQNREPSEDDQSLSRIIDLTRSICLFWTPQLAAPAIVSMDNYNLNASISSSLFLLTASWLVRQMALSADQEGLTHGIQWIHRHFTQHKALITDLFAKFDLETRRLLDGLIEVYAILYCGMSQSETMCTDLVNKSDTMSTDSVRNTNELISSLNEILQLISLCKLQAKQEDSQQGWRQVFQDKLDQTDSEVEDMSVLLRQYFLGARQPSSPDSIRRSLSCSSLPQNSPSGKGKLKKSSPKKKKKS